MHALSDTNLNGHRTDGVWRHTGKLIVASNLELYPPEQPPGQSATLVLPNGIITTPMIAPNAVQQLLGRYEQALSYTLPSTGVWTETPIQATCTFGGGLVRFELAFMLSCPTKGQRVYWDVMTDGVRGTAPALGALDAPENNYAVMAVGTYYATPAAGTHRIGVALNGPVGTLILNNIWATMYVTEQKR